MMADVDTGFLCGHSTLQGLYVSEISYITMWMFLIVHISLLLFHWNAYMIWHDAW